MPRLALAALLLLPALATAADPFVVRWLGQSFVTVTTPSGKVIAFDPHVMSEFDRPNKDKPEVLAKVKADFVCISHEHDDHNRVEEAIEDGADAKKVKVLRGMKADKDKPNKPAEWVKLDEKVKVADGKEYRFRTFGCYHDEMGGLKRGKNSVFIVEADGLTFCHLGDLGHTFTEADAKIIGKIDVLFVPIGGIYTTNAEAAKEIADELKPRLYIVPVHFAVEGKPDTIQGPDEYVDLFKGTKKMTDTNELTILPDAKAEKPIPVLLGWKK